ncbi:hypothetical protein BVG16_05960 [Paenibacillus selenitireducens]|uniref:histidine kinase n=1 Tax=Paenibacillus selenitireducens TaxID=1324314 RepID=A0A1T2XKC8_9BACL|nr:sensor histidine kinase [Paenibacillus selenitireducens]OPA80278.1 hypothetical protein BVG16_05960 [Paenibacillus selenitireducens]
MRKQTLKQICRQYTSLKRSDIAQLQDLAKQLPIMANLAQADVFIDCLTSEGQAAIVVAESKPVTVSSLYTGSVVGQLAYVHHEPAVLYSLHSGQHITGSRGISQEQKEMHQNVAPITNARGQTIGVLIMERDMTNEIEQQRNVAMLQETTEQLSETLLHLAMHEDRMTGLMHEGMILFDQERCITYTNRSADAWLEKLGFSAPSMGAFIAKLLPRNLEATPNQMISHEFVTGSYALEVKSMLLCKEGHPVGGLLLLRDLSELKEKEKELVMKSAFIQEIHHRVKNNLQTISGMLRLQVRRTSHEEVKQTYRDMIHRMNSIALIHDMLAYKGLEHIDLQEVMSRLCPMIIRSLTVPEQNIRLVMNEDQSLLLETEQATTIALIVTELLQNSIIHGFDQPMDRSPLITIDLQRTDEVICMTIADNGKGCADYRTAWEDPSRHFGLNMVRTLVQGQLNGMFQIESSEQGTVARLLFTIHDVDATYEGGEAVAYRFH